MQIYLLPTPKPVINLASYDVKFISDLAQQSMLTQLGLTDRQYELAVKIVRKYERQLRRLNVRIVEDLPSRKPLRSVDRTKKMNIEDNKNICIQFPYNEHLIKQIRVFTKPDQDARGSVRYDSNRKVWLMALTEPNVTWAVNFGRQHHFDISPELDAIEQQLVEFERTPYAIELDIVDDQLIIHNAAKSMLDWLAANNIQMTLDNIVNVAHYNQLLGFTISERAQAKIRQSVPPTADLMFSDGKLHIKPSNLGDSGLKAVFTYTRLLKKKLWVLVNKSDPYYEDILQKVNQEFNSEELLFFPGYNVRAPVDQYSCILVNTYPNHRIESPFRTDVVLTTQGLVQSPWYRLLQNAEKIVYYCESIKYK